MLQHTAIGPDNAGHYKVTYKTPGCDVPTVVCAGMRTHGAAEAEAERLNNAQLVREKILQADALARGLYGVYPDLEQAAA
ncbi:hypothetical protein D0T25_06715 [Duganella sp. BJB488]|uniref:hypothetical protein n=1 Tax=unclassified Duganella TaxID=2636909 RepID=UPI000E34353F|nr:MULTISPECIES: hypothetical protein [unclassified Duganella]RFP23177.1 hypothetical protein D0T26_09135 [Duganella sp. BJB489]RFP24747.1 hypothetical protein D0T25_06715 [Duganella sp. BJB488]RFP34175.1 hypothetical protein D0T24_17515 [Duganella sp. BJB480]